LINVFYLIYAPLIRWRNILLPTYFILHLHWRTKPYACYI